MAATTFEIRPWIRPVIFRLYQNEIQYIEVRGLWHKWITDKGFTEKDGEIYPMTKNYGLVEAESGEMYRVKIRDIRFLDSMKEFDQYAWPKEESDEVDN